MKMKKYIFWTAACFWLASVACKDETAVFDVPVPEESLRFEAVSGGAVMRYTWPKNSDATAICVRYLNERGEEVTMLGTPFVDSLILTGFHTPQTGVPVRITMTDNNNVESVPVEQAFSTLASAPYAFIDSIKVESSWGGVFVESSYTGDVTGLVDVYRVGENPVTKNPDTLYIQNFAISAGKAKNLINLPGEEKETTLVFKTEDGKGNHVRTKIYEGLQKHDMELYPSENLTMQDPGGFSEEYREPPVNSKFRGYSMFGIDFLKDGDKTGAIRLEKGGQYCQLHFSYLTKPDCTNPYVQVELKEAQVIACVRLYGIIRNMAGSMYDDYFNSYYSDFLPCHIKVFGSNDASLPMDEWVELAEFRQHSNPQNEASWCNHIRISTLLPEDYKNVDPYYAEITCSLEENKYKYIRVMALQHFQTENGSATTYGNIQNRYSYQELEVYVQKK